jgi:hypothetical protein
MRDTRLAAERRLEAWADNYRSRDPLVVLAYLAGVSKNRIHHLTGISRSTIDRILSSWEAGSFL